jgi:adenylosuccinate synthase
VLRKIVLLSGPLAVGKSTLAEALSTKFGFRIVKTRELLQRRDPKLSDRISLQKAGARLDRKTGGDWIAEELGSLILDEDSPDHIVIDSLRIAGQVEAIQRSFGRVVVHVHLTADDSELRSRFESRTVDFAEAAYEEAKSDQTERKVESLASVADLLIRTDRASDVGLVVRVAAFLGLYGQPEELVDVLVGGQYGSEGKGQVSAYLAPEYDLLVRVGGANAGHKVWTQAGADCFHHLPSGTNSCEANILLGPGAVLYPPTLLKAVADHRVSANRLMIDPRAMIVEEEDIEKEVELIKAIGSTGQGVGAATARKVLRSIAEPPVRLAGQVTELRPFIRNATEVLEEAFASRQRVFLEGTQGTALSIHHGPYPHVTSRETSVSGCLADAGIGPARVRKTVMVCRTYPIRVANPDEGTSGPMWKETTREEIATRSGIPLEDIVSTEITSTTDRVRRIGEFDWDLLRRSTTLNSPTDIALTFIDYIDVKNRDARRFEKLSASSIHLVEEIERVSSSPVSLISTRFHARSIIDRRSWKGSRRS